MLRDKYVALRIPAYSLYVGLVFVAWYGFIFLYNNWPRYIVLNPPVPERVFTLSEEKTVYIPYSGNTKSSNDKYWKWRKQYDFVPTCCEDLDTAEKIFAYFDKWLNQEGWIKYEGRGFPCGDMIEATFLEEGKNLFAYVPKDAKSPYYSPAVCVAAWPYHVENPPQGFIVELYTTTP